MPVDRARLEQTVRHLATIERPSASEGERQAAQWIAERLREAGLDARVEEERAHGGYWWPQGILSAAGVAAGALALGGRRRTAALIGALAAAAIADDCSAGPHWFRRAFLPFRATWNVVADAGDVRAQQTLVLIAHHDAAHTGLVFDQRAIELASRLAPALLEDAEKWPELFRSIAGAPALVSLGALLGSRRMVRVGMVAGALSTLAFAQIGISPVVPGANDNLTGVAVLIELAHQLRERPVEGVRVVFLSAGSEESFMEGTRAFLRRHAARLSPPHTRFVAVDTVGSPTELVAAESEGMILQGDYDAETKDLLSAAAEEAGVHLRRGLRLSFATDALPAARAGYRAAMVGSVNELKLPSNYHWPTDTADNVSFERVEEAARLFDTLIRRLAVREPAPAPA